MNHSHLPPSFLETRQSELSLPRRRLVELLTRVRFGRIENLVVRGGEPVFDPMPRVLRTCKIGAPAPALTVSGDFVLKREVVDLLQQLQALGNGRVERLDVVNGLPVMLVVEDPACAA